MKLTVIDANAFWTEQLFRQCGRFAEVLLLKPRELRAHRQIYGRWRGDVTPRLVGERVWEQTVSLPPGWMVEMWPWSQRRLSRVIHDFAGSDALTLVITYPQYRGLFSAVKPARTVYYNLDDYRDNWPRHRARVPHWEAETVEAADLTICIAAHRVRVLSEQQPAKSTRIHHLPLGCTPEFMAVPDDRRQTIEGGSSHVPSSDLSPARRPTAGYIGALNYRFDFGFLADVAARLPDVTFVLGGRVQEDGDAAWRAGLARARGQRNVKFLGWVDHAKLAEHLAGFDVLLMPYAHCNFNTNACPAKLWDYLGLGKPIVANDANPETLIWSQVVRVGATAEVFAAQVCDAFAEQGNALRERRLAIAHEHTWEKLAGRLERILTSVS